MAAQVNPTPIPLPVPQPGEIWQYEVHGLVLVLKRWNENESLCMCSSDDRKRLLRDELMLGLIATKEEAKGVREELAKQSMALAADIGKELLPPEPEIILVPGLYRRQS